MEKFTQKYPDLVFESLEDTLKEKLSEQYISLKRGILDLLDKSVDDTGELVNVQNFISNYIKNPEVGKLQDFVEDSDIFERILHNKKHHLPMIFLFWVGHKPTGFLLKMLFRIQIFWC